MAWNICKGHLTQKEFCLAFGTSRTTLWRLGRSVERSRPRRKPSSSKKWQQRALDLCRKHIRYGYRMIWANLKREGFGVGVHRVRLWMKEQGLLQSAPVKDTGRTPGARPSEPTGPSQAWQMDATKVYTHQDGWVWITSVLDVYDRRVVSSVVRKTCRAEDAEDALALALEESFGSGRPSGLKVIHDRGSQFVAHRFREMLRGLGIADIVCAVRHPQSCGRLERFHKTLKSELVWLQEWEGLEDLQEAVKSYLWHYNNERLHSSLNYKTPIEVYQAATSQKIAA